MLSLSLYVYVSVCVCLYVDLECETLYHHHRLSIFYCSTPLLSFIYTKRRREIVVALSLVFRKLLNLTGTT